MAGEGDQVVDVAPAVLVTTNGAPASVRAEYRRRAVVLDTGPLEPLLGDLDVVGAHLLAPETLPRLDLGRLAPSAIELDAGDRGLLRDLLRSLLTAEGWRASDRMGLELVALGRAALWSADPESAVIATALDYATCGLTVGEAIPERLGELRRLAAGSADSLGGAVEAAEVERERLEHSRRDARAAAERESLALIGARAALAQRLEDAERELGRLRQRSAHHAVAAGVGHQLQALRSRVVESRSRARLEELAEPARELLGQAAAIGAQAQEERRQDKEARELERAARALQGGEDSEVRALPAPPQPVTRPALTREQRREQRQAMVAYLQARRVGEPATFPGGRGVATNDGGLTPVPAGAPDDALPSWARPFAR